MKLFFVTDIQADGDNRDLFVWCDTPGQAASYWSRYYDEEHQTRVVVREAPTHPKRGPVNWDNIPRHHVPIAED